MKLAHRPRIASATIKLISKPMIKVLLSILREAIIILSYGAEYPKHRPYQRVRKGQCAAVWQINFYYIISLLISIRSLLLRRLELSCIF